jgi:hypothetical protein
VQERDDVVPSLESVLVAADLVAAVPQVPLVPVDGKLGPGCALAELETDLQGVVLARVVKDVHLLGAVPDGLGMRSRTERRVPAACRPR